MNSPRKLGLRPHKIDLRDLLFKKYRTDAPLPRHPANFGHEKLIGDWGMLGNDRFGDCFYAGMAHQFMLWAAAAGRPIPRFSAKSVLESYSEGTGFDIGNPDDTDHGTDMREGMKYMRDTGLLDDDGNRHFIDAFVWIPASDMESLLESVYLGGATGIGIQMPDTAQRDFEIGRPWSRHLFSNPEGGHYVPVVSDRVYPEVVTWGRVQPMTRAFYLEYCDMACMAISREYLSKDGKSPEGFDLDQLIRDANQLAGISQ